jgi:D-glycero-alpha-D-manno-heptose-7-phosphate kinase
MIAISRTPYRISFFGGGTDYPTWYQQHGACVLSTTINWHCYLVARWLAPFFPHKSRVVWSKVEQVNEHAAIEHPSVRATLDYLNIQQGVEIQHQGDLPARSGLGSSSAFTVGLLHTLYALQGVMPSKRQLACEAVHIEHDLLRENVGVQDQIQTAYGGFNQINIEHNGDFHVKPIILPRHRVDALQDHLLLFFTGISRTASDVAGEKIKSLASKETTLKRMQAMVEEAVNILTSAQDISLFGELLHDSWQLKRSITSQIANDLIDDTYDRARKAGAVGGKILGAGGGGFMLFFAPPERHPAILSALSHLLYVPMEFERNGTQIIFCDGMSYSETSLRRRDFKHLQSDNMALSEFITRPKNHQTHLPGKIEVEFS